MTRKSPSKRFWALSLILSIICCSRSLSSTSVLKRFARRACSIRSVSNLINLPSKMSICFLISSRFTIDHILNEFIELSCLVHDGCELFRCKLLLSITLGLSGVNVNFHDQSVSSGRNGGVYHGFDQFLFSCSVGRVYKNRKM